MTKHKYRVVQFWTNQGEDLYFAIGVPAESSSPDCHPLTHFAYQAHWAAAPTGYSKDELRAELLAMLAALDEPTLKLTPARLIPVQLEVQAADRDD